MGQAFGSVKKIDKIDSNLNTRILKELEYKNKERIIEEKLRKEQQAKYEEEKKKRSFKRGLKNLSLNDGMKSSVHCFPTFFDPNAFLLVKIIWVLITMLSWSYWLYQTYGLYQSYASYSAISSYSLGYDTKSIFPAVTICNLNPYDGGVSKAYMNNILSNKSIHALNYSNLVKYTDAANNQFKSEFEYYNFEFKNFSLYYQGYYFIQMLLSCEFNGIKCSINDFYWFHDYNYGNCYRFNGGDSDQNGDGYDSPITVSYPIKNSKKPGWENGLRLELYTGSQDEQLQYIYKAGMRITVNNQSYVPFPDEDGVDISTGKQTNIAIRRKFISRLSDPFSNCVDEITEQVSAKNDVLLEMYKQKQSGQIKLYQQQYCLKICQQYYFVSKCKCYSYSLQFLNVSSLYNSSSVKGCVFQGDVDCLESADLEFANSDEIEKCYNKCPQQCNEITYDLRLSEAYYPNFNYIFTQYPNQSEEFHSYLVSTTMMVNVYYESNSYTIIKEVPSMTFYSLISNIGGNMGLFTGASVLSLIELVEYFISVIILFLDLKLSNKVNLKYSFEND